MLLIVGLGNPGKKYEFTRHNIGFIIVDSLKLKVKSFSNWKTNKKLLSETSQGEINGQKVILSKPLTFMNLSGKAVKSLLKTFNTNHRLNTAIAELKWSPKRLWIIHDDIDLPLGEIRIAIGRGAAGHKGVESIIRELKTKDFVRFRVGIKQNLKFPDAFGRTPRMVANQNSKPQFKTKNLEKFVLKKFTKDEKKIVKEVIQKAVEAIEMAIKEGAEKAMNKYN